MKFVCSDDHFYKLFIDSILEMEPTYLVQDYLNQVQYIYFDEEDLANPSSEIAIQSDDITALKDIVSPQELNKIMIHRFVDGLKKMITSRLDADDNHGYHKLCIRIGEYRELLLSYVQNINEVITPELKLMEDELSNHFKTDRHKAAVDVCNDLKLESEIPFEDETGNPLDVENYEGITEKYDEDKPLEFLTHNRNKNIGYKTQKRSWESYKAQFNRLFKDLKNNDILKTHIKSRHNLLINSKINEVQTFKEIQEVINIDINDITFKSHTTQGYLKSNLCRIGQHDQYKKLLNTYTHNKNYFEVLAQHAEILKSRTNTIYSNLRRNIDKAPRKPFNTDETLQLLLHIEMHSLLKSSVRNGSLKEKEQYLINNYMEMVEDMKKYLVHTKKGENADLYWYMKEAVFQDLFGRTKIDAANIFRTTISKMEDTLSITLNNTNYNFASFNIIKLLEKFITAFDEFIKENDEFNHDIHTSDGGLATELPDLNTLMMYFKKIEKHNITYKDFTNKHKIDFQIDSLILKTFNDINVYDEKGK